MNITINGNVTINGSIVSKENLSLRQLRGILPSTKEVKTPTRDWVREHLEGDQVFFTKEFANGDRLVVFTNGFYCFGDENWTILRADGFSRLYYETDEEGGYEHLEEGDFIDDCFISALGLNAMWQLKRNEAQRKSNTNLTPTDSEILERQMDESTPDVLETFIAREDQEEEHKRLCKAWDTLTQQQKDVIWLIKVKKISQDEVAKSLGISQQRVSRILSRTTQKLKNNFCFFPDRGV